MAVSFTSHWFCEAHALEKRVDVVVFVSHWWLESSSGGPLNTDLSLFLFRFAQKKHWSWCCLDCVKRSMILPLNVSGIYVMMFSHLFTLLVLRLWITDFCHREKIIIIKKIKTHGAKSFTQQVCFHMSAGCCRGICFPDWLCQGIPDLGSRAGKGLETKLVVLFWIMASCFQCVADDWVWMVSSPSSLLLLCQQTQKLPQRNI